MALTNEQMEESFAQFQNPDAARSAEDVVKNIDRQQRQIPGAYGHQADYYQLSPAGARRALTNAGQETRTSPSTAETEADREGADGLQRTAKHVGATVVGAAVPELREFGSILGTQDEAAAADSLPPDSASLFGQPGSTPRQQGEATPAEEPSIADRLAGL